jgi:hypothetical protein
MSTMLATDEGNSATHGRWPAPAAEAARYALLRRLAPSMRHHLVVNLQPIGMIYEVLDRRLRAPEPNLASVHESAVKINGFARAALDSCVDVVSWLAPDDAVACDVVDGARECAGLLTSSLSFRGYALRNEVVALDGAVRRSSIRFLLTAALVHVTDERPAPAEVAVRGASEEAGVRLTLTVRQTDGNDGFANEPGYRQLSWDDVCALAEAEGAQATRHESGQVSLLLPWAA